MPFKKPKPLERMAPGPQSIARQGFWAFHFGHPANPSKTYREHSPLWHLYRRGYAWASEHPQEIPTWAYGDWRAIEKAVELALKWAPHVKVKDDPIYQSNHEALQAVWRGVLERKPWRKLQTLSDEPGEEKPPSQSRVISEPRSSRSTRT